MPSDPKSARKTAGVADMRISFAPLKDGTQVDPFVVTVTGFGEGEIRLTADRMIEVLGASISQARQAGAEQVSFRRRTPLKPEDIVVQSVDLVPASIGLAPDAPAIRYYCNGIHPDDGGGWSDWANGVTQEEAEFHARWMMALNGEDHPPSDPFELDAFVGAMAESKIDYIVPEPVTKDELAGAAARFVEEVGGSTGPAYDEIVEMLGKLDVRIGSPAKRMG